MEKRANVGYYNLILNVPKGKVITYENVYLGDPPDVLQKINESPFISFFYKDERIMVPTLRIYEVKEVWLYLCERCGKTVTKSEIFSEDAVCCNKCLTAGDLTLEFDDDLL